MLIKNQQNKNKKSLPLRARLDVKSFAEQAGTSYRTIYRYIKSGQLVPRRTLGGRVYFLYADVDLFKNHLSSEPLILDGAPIDEKQ